jgi:hypothetical protein
MNAVHSLFIHAAWDFGRMVGKCQSLWTLGKGWSTEESEFDFRQWQEIHLFSTAHPASYPVGTCCAFSKVKAVGASMWPLPHSAEVKIAWSCTSAPPYAFMPYLVKHRRQLYLSHFNIIVPSILRYIIWYRLYVLDLKFSRGWGNEQCYILGCDAMQSVRNLEMFSAEHAVSIFSDGE